MAVNIVCLTSAVKFVFVRHQGCLYVIGVRICCWLLLCDIIIGSYEQAIVGYRKAANMFFPSSGGAEIQYTIASWRKM